MKLITEHLESELDYLTEKDEKGNKNVFIEGIFMQAEQQNRNNRIYPRAVLEGACGKYIKEQVETGRAVGELNHPEGPAINLDKVSHRITELRWDGNNVVGKALILNTPMGNIVKGLMEGGCRLGVSSRGMGTVENKNNKTLVREDFMLATVDIVQDPSAPQAFVNGIMEGVDYFYNGKTGLYEKCEIVKEKLKKMSSSQIAENQLLIFKDFLNGI